MLESEDDPAAYMNFAYDEDTKASIRATAARLKQLVLEKIENATDDPENATPEGH